jgi:VWFA-related protein
MLTPPTWAQPEPEATGPQLKILGIDVTGLPSVTARVLATDADGEPVRGLLVSDLTVLVDEVPCSSVEVRAQSTGDSSLATVLVIDHSLSMSKKAVDDACTAAKRYVEISASADEVGLISFADGISVDIPPTAEKPRVMDALGSIAPRGNRTYLYDAIARAAEELDLRGFDRKAVIALTDGKDEGSGKTLGQVVAWCEDRGVSVFTIGLGDRIAPDALARLASGTGGRSFTTSDTGSLVSIYETIADSLAQEYLVSFQQEPDGQGHVLTVGISRGPIEATASMPFVTGVGGGGGGSTATDWSRIGLMVGVAVLAVVASALLVVLTVRKRRSA